MENDDLVDAINMLTEKLHGVGIEIYQLNDTINGLKNAIDRLKEDKDL